MSGVDTLAFTQHWRGSLTDYVTAIAWSPNGKFLAASSAAGEVVRMPLDELGAIDEMLRVEDGTSIDSLAFSADGQLLAAAGQAGTVHVWSMHLAQSAAIATLDNAPAWVDQLAWHPQQQHLAYSLGKYVQVWNADTQSLLTTLNFEESSVLDLAWHPQGEFLAIAGYHGLKIWNARDWNADPEVLDIPSASTAIAWSADGAYLAAGNLDRTIAVVEWGNPAPWVMRGFPGKIRHLAWSDPALGEAPRLAVASASSVVVWEKHDDEAIGWDGHILGDHDGMIPALAFQPGTAHLATAAADGWVGLWHNALHLAQTLDGAPEGFTCLAWHPQAQMLAAGGQQGELVVWSVD
jgi:WD40 repeat protein